jgi:hypothetical protein
VEDKVLQVVVDHLTLLVAAEVILFILAGVAVPLAHKILLQPAVAPEQLAMVPVEHLPQEE